MINAPTSAGSAEVTAIDTRARGPLFLLLGSVILPLKAVVMNLLSISASFGAIIKIPKS